jgi:hypothetical protein
MSRCRNNRFSRNADAIESTAASADFGFDFLSAFCPCTCATCNTNLGSTFRNPDVET